MYIQFNGTARHERTAKNIHFHPLSMIRQHTYIPSQKRSDKILSLLTWYICTSLTSSLISAPAKPTEPRAGQIPENGNPLLLPRSKQSFFLCGKVDLASKGAELNSIWIRVTASGLAGRGRKGNSEIRKSGGLDFFLATRDFRQHP